ncbi:MAG: hypothetical protein U9N79_07710 [Actinomycetota bacterium]|nr:hypothetical protein [Actinomycetota bacterium]
MRTETIGYRAFLLRVWTRPEGGGARASIRDVETGETHAFDDLDRLRDWLGREVHTNAGRGSTVASTGTRRGSSRVSGPRLNDDIDAHDDEVAQPG